MKEIQLGKVMLTFKGEYDSTKSYTRLDAVTYQGSSYVCLSDTSSAPPGDSWQLLADKGATGDVGPQGLPGKDGVTPHIDSTTGDWFIGNQDTGTQAQGPAGKNGKDGVDGQPGKDGQNGITPHIDTATGNWFVGSTDTGIKAQGPQGQQGNPGKDGVTPDVSNLAAKTDLANYYTKTETDTKLSTKADQAEYQTLNDKVSNMQIGGRNLLTGTQNWQGEWGWKDTWPVDTEMYKDLVVRKHSNAWYGLGQYYDAKPNTTYTFSFYAKASEVCNNMTIFVLYSDNWSSPVVSVPDYSNRAVTTEWQRYSVTFTTKSGGKLYPSVDSNKDGITIYVAGYKLEEGTIPTDWTPAPEDFDTKLDAKVDKSELVDYAKKSDIPASADLSGYATISSLIDYVKKTDLPDFTLFAKKSDIPVEQDLSNYAKKDDLNKYVTNETYSQNKTSLENTIQNLRTSLSNQNQVQTITSGTLADLANKRGSYHYEIECLPSDTPIQEWGLCDVVVGQYYAKQVFTVTGATDDDQGNVYVRVRDYSGQWHEWREITAWN